MRCSVAVHGGAVEVDADEVAIAARDVSKHFDDGRSGLPHGVEEDGIGAGGGAQDEPVDTVLAKAREVALLRFEGLARVDQQKHAIGFVQHALGAGNHIGEEGVGDVADHDADEQRLVEAQRGAPRL